jgi:hypothetical protein
LEKKLCKKCGKELPKDWNDKLCEECKEKRKGFIKKVLIGIGAVGVFGAAVVAVLASSTSSDDDDYDFDNDYTGSDDGSIEDSATAKQHPLLPAKAFLWLYDHWGEDAAQEVLDKVQIGEMSVDEVETYINRPDINPKDWADYEDGWRPSWW